jgi:hypothetical protein
VRISCSRRTGDQRPTPSCTDGKITTDAPNVLWGTDGARVLTVDDGWGWVLVAVEHFNVECVGYHVCKLGGIEVVWGLPGVGANLHDHAMSGVVYRAAQPVPPAMNNHGEVRGLLRSGVGLNGPDIQLMFVDVPLREHTLPGPEGLRRPPRPRHHGSSGSVCRRAER